MGSGWKTRIIAGLLPAALLAGCAAEGFDREQARREILALHQQQRVDHLEKRAASLVSQFAEDFVDVNRGQVSRRQAEEHIARLGRYFAAVEFQAWDDIEPPELHFSEDGSLAYTVVQKRVITRPAGDAPVADEALAGTDFAWIAIYRRGADGWKLEAVASTDRPWSGAEAVQ